MNFNNFSHRMANALDFTPGHFAQLIGVLFATVILFLVAYRTPLRIIVSLLILLIPFQFVETRYGSSNIALTYVFFIALYLRGSIRLIPLWGVVLLILMAYMISLSQVPPSVYREHIPYLIALVSAFLVFFIIYNFVRQERDVHFIPQLLLWLNLLVIIYSIAQILIGETKVALFGIKEFTLTHARGGNDPRLTGPFNAVGIMAEYLVITILLIAYELVHEQSGRKRLLLYGLLASDMALLIATANRGGFLSLILGMILFLILFRRELGLRRIVGSLIAGVTLLAVGATVIINYTSYGRMFERLSQTKVEAGVPDTRSVTWPMALEQIKNKPLLGHGPQLRLYKDFERKIPGHTPIFFPHNLYLYLLYTVGVVGLVAFMMLFLAVMLRTRRAARYDIGDPYLHGLLRMGALLIFIVLVDQIKLEFLRSSLIDYWHYLFMLLALFVGLADTALERTRGKGTEGDASAAPVAPPSASVR
ncbi:hypothetical protein MNBD_GAMMA24-926 [hydrothermal vent metagenome]|uniref:O-antigen ligase-related domain-containing protein n=1 Tax=hydrothermal vent metagenome TaxID=652676 RepID=A0A3B1C4K8_9ZZZZ